MKLRIVEDFTGNVPGWLRKAKKLTKEYGRTEAGDYSNNMNFVSMNIPKNKQDILRYLNSDDNKRTEPYILHYVNPESGEDIVWDLYDDYTSPKVLDPRTGSYKALKTLPSNLLVPYIQDFGKLYMEDPYDLYHKRGDRRSQKRNAVLSKDDPSFEKKLKRIDSKLEIIDDAIREASALISDLEYYCLSPQSKISDDQRAYGESLYQELTSEYREMVAAKNKIHDSLRDAGYYNYKEYQTIPYEVPEFSEFFRNLSKYNNLIQEVDDFVGSIKNLDRKSATYTTKSNRFYCDDYEIEDLFDMENAEEILQRNGWIRNGKVYIPKGTNFVLDGRDVYYEYIKLTDGPLKGLRIGFVPDDEEGLSLNHFLKYCEQNWV